MGRITYEVLMKKAILWRENLEENFNTNKVSASNMNKLIRRTWGYDNRTLNSYKNALELENIIVRQGYDWIILPKKEFVKGNEKKIAGNLKDRIRNELVKPKLSVEEKEILKAKPLE